MIGDASHPLHPRYPNKYRLRPVGASDWLLWWLYCAIAASMTAFVRVMDFVLDMKEAA